MTESKTPIVDTLEAWYLASLRKRAVERQADLTPSALIDADKKHIESLVIGKEVDNAPTLTHLHNPPGAMQLKGTLLCAAVLAAASCVSSILGQTTLASALAFASAALACAAFYYATTHFLAPLKKVRQRLANWNSDTRTFSDIDSAVENILAQSKELEEGKTLIADAAPDGLCALDQTLTVQALNNTLSSWLGYLKHEIVGMPFSSFVIAEDFRKFETATTAAIHGKPSDWLDLRLLTKSGGAIDLRVSMDWSASNNAIFICTKDVSHEKRLERARAEYISTMSHDIKIPLTSALLSIESLTQHKEDARKTDRIILRAGSSLERLIGLIDELLEYERSASGKLSLSYSSVAVSELVNNAIEAVRPQAEAKRINLVTNTPDISIRVDKSKIERTIINLLSNAIKFSPADSKVEIAAEKRNEMLEFVVIDNGPGIPAKYNQLIFQRYERIPDSEHVEGTGLGLSICRTIIESHQGLIGVKPALPMGSQFWFNLPINPS